MSKIIFVFAVILLFGVFLYGCESNTNPVELAQEQHQGPPQVIAPNGDEQPPECGRMTGGGSVFMEDGTRVTRGFELHCCPTEPNNLQVNWRHGNKFHLLELETANCFDADGYDPYPPTASFDTFEGFGNGRYNGVEGATIRFIFEDHGEPGDEDRAEIQIWDVDGNEVLFVSGPLDRGNLQAH